MKNLLSYVYLYNFIINYVYIFFNTFCVIKIFNHMLKQFIVVKILIRINNSSGRRINKNTTFMIR